VPCVGDSELVERLGQLVGIFELLEKPLHSVPCLSYNPSDYQKAI
jgi:hypothetical protein